MEVILTLLLEAIKGELQAEHRYGLCAVQAKKEGLPTIGILFSALARAEAIHAANHRRALEKNNGRQMEKLAGYEPAILSTVENLSAAIVAERGEFQTMYPRMEKQIRKAYGNSFTAKIALLSLRWACESEQEHCQQLQKAYDAAREGRDLSGEVYLCSVCGNLHLGSGAPEKLCPVCGHDLSFYTRVQ